MRYNLIMTAQRFSSELKEQVVLEVVEKDRTIAEVARSYGLVPQTVGNWVKKWRKDHPESVDSEVGAEQSAENRRLRAELREARMEIEFLKKAASFLRAGVPVWLELNKMAFWGQLLRDSWLAFTEGLL